MVRPPGHQATPQILRAGPTIEVSALGGRAGEIAIAAQLFRISSARGHLDRHTCPICEAGDAAIDGTGTPAGAALGIAGKPAEDLHRDHRHLLARPRIPIARAFLSRAMGIPSEDARVIYNPLAHHRDRRAYPRRRCRPPWSCCGSPVGRPTTARADLILMNARVYTLAWSEPAAGQDLEIPIPGTFVSGDGHSIG
jgi:hypothetical protein